MSSRGGAYGAEVVSADAARAGERNDPRDVVADTVERTRGWVDAHGLLPRGSCGLVALSGGPDSLCLAHLLRTLAKERGLKLHALCIDHGVRPESVQETECAVALAEALGIAGQAQSLGRRLQGRGNLQERARIERLALLHHEARRLGAHWIALGHTADDQAETVLMRMIRGTGTRGLGAMAASSGLIVRPLLWATRERVEAYLRRGGLEAVRDPSNAGDAYLRNRVRHALLPGLRDENPQILNALSRLADSCREDEEALAAAARQEWARCGGEDGLDTRALVELLPGVMHRVLALAHSRASGGRRGLTRDHLVQVARLARGAGGTRAIDLPGVRALRVYDRLVFVGPVPRGGSLGPIEVTGPGIWSWAEGPGVEIGEVLSGGNSVDELAQDAVRWPLTLRGPVSGDRIEIGGGHTKKVFRALLDAKVPRAQRSSHPVVVQDGRVVLVLGLRRAPGLAPAPGRPALRFSRRK